MSMWWIEMCLIKCSHKYKKYKLKGFSFGSDYILSKRLSEFFICRKNPVADLSLNLIYESQMI